MKLISKNSLFLIWFVVFVIAIAIVGIGYLVFQPNTESKNSAAKMKEFANATATIIKSGDSEFGSILFDGNNQAIYIWESEESKTAECYGDCAEAWPPVLTNGSPTASGDVSVDLLGTTKRTDGTTQITYNGHPLYYYAHEKPGEVKCHNISTHGGLWWAIQPSGVRAI